MTEHGKRHGNWTTACAGDIRREIAQRTMGLHIGYGSAHKCCHAHQGAHVRGGEALDFHCRERDQPPAEAFPAGETWMGAGHYLV